MSIMYQMTIFEIGGTLATQCDDQFQFDNEFTCNGNVGNVPKTSLCGKLGS